MRAMLPFVTVLIPAYNAEKTIRRALDSVIAQAYPQLEIIVIDDASRDATADVVRHYEKAGIQLIRLTQNLGECGAMNEGLAAAKGSYIAFLDADDEWLAAKLAKQVEALERNPAATFATCGCLFVDTKGRAYRRFGMPPAGLDKSQAWRHLLRGSFIAKPCVVARTSALARVGLFDVNLAVAGDQDMWIRLSMAGEVEFIEEFLTIAHDTPNSLTRVHATRAADYVLPMVRRHLAARGQDLSHLERREILGERYTSIGRNLYVNGRLFRGATFIFRGMACGSHVGENAWYLVTASPLAQLTKRAIGGALASPTT
jgi:glycosyltransferase involved in cell wall biosynthesis